ncbi:hypothetical protein EPN90_00810 [Patescibacteria group bacterium]|nr:MAG: hypothetical protein EPN90_00810 [Patescibacteria group bacterium]
MPSEKTNFRIELFSRGGDPRTPPGRVFELPCPGLPADARLFGVIHTREPGTTSTVASLVRNAMLSAETITRRTLQTGFEGRFEAILLAVNRGFSELKASGTLSPEILPDSLLGLLIGNEILLSGRGAVQALLFRPKEGMTPRDLFAEEEKRRDSNVLFRTIVSGTIRPADVLLLTTSELFNFVALPHLSRLLVSLPTQHARTRLLELLSDVPPETCLSGVLIGGEAEKQRTVPTVKKAAAPSQPREAGKIPALPKRPSDIFITPRRARLAALKAGAKLVLKKGMAAGQWLAAKLNALGRLLGNKHSRQALVASFKQSPDRAIDQWNRLERRTKLLSLALILLLLFFGESLRYLAGSRAAGERVSRYNQAIAEVQAKRDAAEASLIYKDEARAWQFLSEAEAKVRELPAGTAAEKRAVGDLLAQIENDKEKLRHIIRLDGLAELIALPAGAGQGVTLLSSEKLLTLVSDRGGVWNWDLNKKRLAPAIAPFLDSGSVRRAYSGKKSPLFFTEKNLVERVATSTVSAPLNLPTNSAVAATALWNGKLYALAPEANQVYRGTKSKSGWNLSVAALKDPDIRDAVDLVIDGAIWVVKPTTIKRYLSGANQNFELKTTDPAPRRLVRVWVGDDRLLLYDAELKRLFLFNANGTFKAQYAGGPAEDVRDIALDAKKKIVWILTGTGLYETKLPE